MVTHARIPFSDLVFLDDNPRTRTPDGLRRMADDIQADPTFFDNRPVLVNLTAGRYQVYAGDLRAHAAHDVLGWPDIPCNVEPDVPDATMRRRAIQDNTHREGWDAQVLRDSWGDVDLQGLGLDAEAWGGDADEQPNNTATEDDYEPPAEIQTDIVTGDLFEIGPHRLLCGDSTSADDVGRLMNGERVDLMVTDPPYGINLNTDYSNMGATKKKYRPINGDSCEFDLSPVFAAYSATIKYIWGGDYFINSIDFLSGTPIVWAKRHSEEERSVFGSGFEILWTNRKTKRDIWFIRPINQSSERLGVHPTQKPVECMARPIKNHEGDVYDPFLGSGTTMVAAHQLNRRCYGMEIDPKYCQVIVDRMIRLDPSLPITINGKPYTGV